MKTLLSLFGNISLLLAIAANCPSDLQALIMSVLPKSWQPYTAVIFGIAGVTAKVYEKRQTNKAIALAATTGPSEQGAPTGLGPIKH